MFTLTDPDAFRRGAAGVGLILALLCLLPGMIVDPLGFGVEDTLGYAENPRGTGVSATLLHYAWVLWVPGVIGMVHLVRCRGASSPTWPGWSPCSANRGRFSCWSSSAPWAWR
ncbi:hypothetical protein [Streptosporangium sp. NPDC049644]|uniref:hypothetical protein n=1 Tax=Streptosporangium sp. NPDC049644 TaxID=3155507 RepID=UPI003417C864